MDFQCSKNSKWRCLHSVYWENDKCPVGRPFEWSRAFWAFISVVLTLEPAGFKTRMNECQFSYDRYMTKACQNLIANNLNPTKVNVTDTTKDNCSTPLSVKEILDELQISEHALLLQSFVNCKRWISRAAFEKAT